MTFHARAAAAAALLGLLATPALADRRLGLNNDVLVEDDDDVFLFPQKTLQYRNLIVLEYWHPGILPAPGFSGNGVILMGGDNLAFGVAANRPETNLLLVDGFTAPSTLVDLFLAFGLGGNSSLGFRLGLRHGTDSVDPDQGGESDDGQFVVNLAGGYSMGGGEYRADLSGNFAFITASRSANGDDVADETDIRFNVLGRAYKRLAEQTELGMLGMLGLRSGSRTDHGAQDRDSSELVFGLAAGAGPVYHPGPRTIVTMHGLLGLRYRSEDPNEDADDDETSGTALFIPAVQMAFEHGITDWFYFRSGASYAYSIEFGSRGKDDTTETAGAFGWNTGLGLWFGEKDEFRIDGALSQNWITNGPYFLSGADTDALFGVVEASYDW